MDNILKAAPAKFLNFTIIFLLKNCVSPCENCLSATDCTSCVAGNYFIPELSACTD